MLTCYSGCFSILSLRSWNSGVITYASAPQLSTSASFPADWAANLTKIGSLSNPSSGMHLHLWSSGTRIFDWFVPRLRLILAGPGSWMSWTGRNYCGCPLSSYSCNWSHLDHTVFLSCLMEVFADDHLLLIWWGALGLALMDQQTCSWSSIDLVCWCCFDGKSTSAGAAHFSRPVCWAPPVSFPRHSQLRLCWRRRWVGRRSNILASVVWCWYPRVSSAYLADKSGLTHE